MSTDIHEHQHQQQQQQFLQLPRASMNIVDRRGSIESAYYSIYSDGDRRGSWQDGEVELSDSSASCIRRTLSGSVLCEQCESRRFRPTDRSPFHTRSHAEVVMAEFASLSGERAIAAAAAAAATSKGGSTAGLQMTAQATSSTVPKTPTLLLPAAALSPPLHSHHLPPPLSPSASVDPLPPLAEEADQQADGQGGDEVDDGRIGIAGRLNTVSGCDLRRRRKLSTTQPDPMSSTTSQVSTAAESSAAADADGGVGKRKFSLDASTLTTPSWSSRSTQLVRRTSTSSSSAAAAAGGGLFRLFHQETTPEQLAMFNKSRRSSSKSTLVGDEQDETGSQTAQPDQNPSRLFRRFQSTDDDYFVALKVEEPPAESYLPAVRERRKLLSIGEDGSTVVTELSAIAEQPTPTSTPSAETLATNSASSTTAGSLDSSQTESEIEIALRLARSSPFAYVPPARLQEAPASDCRAASSASERRRPSAGPTTSRPSLHQPQQQRDVNWRRCVSELQTASDSPGTTAASAGASTSGVDGGSRVKRLMAKFGDGN